MIRSVLLPVVGGDSGAVALPQCLPNCAGADLAGVDMSGANLARADFDRADLSRAALSDAKLTRAYLSNAILFGTDLSGANLHGAIMDDANPGKSWSAPIWPPEIYSAVLTRAYLGMLSKRSPDPRYTFDSP